MFDHESEFAEVLFTNIFLQLNQSDSLNIIFLTCIPKERKQAHLLAHVGHMTSPNFAFVSEPNGLVDQTLTEEHCQVHHRQNFLACNHCFQMQLLISSPSELRLCFAAKTFCDLIITWGNEMQKAHLQCLS